MTNIGVICPILAGHLNPMIAISKELRNRGHKVTFFQIPDAEVKILGSGLEFCSIGENNFPLGTWPKFLKQLEQYKGLKATLYWHEESKRMVDTICFYAPKAMRDKGIEMLLVDQMEPSGALVAEYLDIPFVTVCNSLTMIRENSIPPAFTPWSYQNNRLGRWRNIMAYSLSAQFLKPIKAIFTDYRRRWNLPPNNLDDIFLNSTLAQISQQPPDFEFPRSFVPDCFHYLGPFRDASPQNVKFPYERLNNQPLIYASLGTMQTNKYDLFYTIADACRELDVQLVLSHGGGLDQSLVDSLPGEHLVVGYAPQLELLEKAKLTISHGGLNTVLDSLSNGVPLVTMPIAFEQPGIAARVQWTGTGNVISPSHLTVSELRKNIEQVMGNTSYYDNATNLQKSIKKAGGAKRAVNVIEQVIATGKPVLNNNSLDKDL